MEDVLNVMQLVDVQHSLVGNVERRGISGGQRKRVNIGISVEERRKNRGIRGELKRLNLNLPPVKDFWNIFKQK